MGVKIKGPNIEMYNDDENLAYQFMQKKLALKIIDSCEEDLEHKRASERFLGIYFYEFLWPALKKMIIEKRDIRELGVDKIELNIIPLDRLGQKNGMSGSGVVLGYFETENVTFPSLPMIIKLSETGKGHISEEFEHSMEIFPYLRSKGTFILPFYMIKEKNMEFLISSSKVRFDDRKVAVGNSYIRTLMNVLEELEKIYEYDEISKKTETICNTFDYLYYCLRDIHSGPSHEKGKVCIEDKEYGCEYKRYLRNTIDIKKNVIDKSIEGLWCEKKNTECTECTMKCSCPSTILKKLLHKTSSFHMGGIHGDFHPRNIIYLDYEEDGYNEASIIDYGWANINAHIAKDFVLMECNFRFMALKSAINSASLKKLCNALTDAELDNLLNNKSLTDYCNSIIRIIKNIRKNFIKTIKYIDSKLEIDNDFFLKEYIVPMFFVAFGLVKYHSESRNQRAMEETLYALSNFLFKYFDDGEIS